MMLFVGTTDALFGEATRVAELVIEDKEVDEEDAYTVEPDDCEAWLTVWLRLGRLVFAPIAGKTGVVFVLVSGP